MSETTEPGGSNAAPEPFVDTTAPEAAPPETTAPPGNADTDDPADDAGADDQPKRAKGVQKRIDELTADKHRAIREAEQWREVALRAQQPPAPQPGQPAAEQPLPPDLAQAVGPAPDPAKFQAGEYDPEYIRAAARHDMRVDQARGIAGQRQAQMRQAQAQYGARVHSIMQDAIKAAPEIEATITASDFPMAAHVVRALTEADDPAAMLAHLARNRADAERISKLSPFAAARELGKIEARMSATPPAAVPSNAPSPPRTVRGSGAVPRDPAQASSMEEYARLRGGG